MEASDLAEGTSNDHPSAIRERIVLILSGILDKELSGRRKAYLSKYLEGNTMIEIAAIYDVNKSTVFRAIMGDYRNGVLHRDGAVQVLRRAASRDPEIQLMLQWLRQERTNDQI